MFMTLKNTLLICVTVVLILVIVTAKSNNINKKIKRKIHHNAQKSYNFYWHNIKKSQPIDIPKK